MELWRKLLSSWCSHFIGDVRFPASVRSWLFSAFLLSCELQILRGQRVSTTVFVLSDEPPLRCCLSCRSPAVPSKPITCHPRVITLVAHGAARRQQTLLSPPDLTRRWSVGQSPRAISGQSARTHACSFGLGSFWLWGGLVWNPGWV